MNKDEIRNRLAQNLNPFNYNNPLSRFYKAVIKNEKDPIRKQGELSSTKGGGNPARYALLSKALDNANTGVKFEDYFTTSDYRPVKEFNPNSIYYKYQVTNDPSFSLHSPEEWKAKHSYHMFTSELGAYTLGKGADNKGNYYSIYDKWDINPFGLNISDFTGITVPFELYDRVYESEPLYKIIDEDYKRLSKSTKPSSSGNIIVGKKSKSYKQGGIMNYLEYFKKGGIYIKPKNRGKFTKSAKAAGEGVQEHAHKVMNDPHATTLQKRRANFAINSKKWHHGKKHSEGGVISYLDFFE